MHPPGLLSAGSLEGKLWAGADGGSGNSDGEET